ncbi:hypothetical protein HHK36_031826 [Tetracentron sinense]|uniref:DNA-directed RNA polymerase III subunit RPC4 n=1 Tax=Tetracentron sinense TaxID=13715 RepID=A0A834YAA5_TETSI|nr:hypothetical protein HHK36_031826 [Tetracentron sinense]
MEGGIMVAGASRPRVVADGDGFFIVKNKIQGLAFKLQWSHIPWHYNYCQRGRFVLILFHREICTESSTSQRTKTAETKIEAVDDAEAAAQTQGFIAACHSAPVQVSFGYGGLSTSIRSYGPPKGGSSSNRSQGPVSDGCATASCTRVEKEYKDHGIITAIILFTLPLRRRIRETQLRVLARNGAAHGLVLRHCKIAFNLLILLSELLDEGEFGEALESAAYDENSTKPAVELGLMGVVPLEKACSLDKLPPGFMGKMLVYKSGAIKLKLGDIRYDVSSGSDCLFAQDVVAINTEEKHCCIVGELNKRAIITPDVDSLLN